MSPFARYSRVAVALAALTVGLSAAAPLAAASASSGATKVPFTDTNIDGWLSFCSRNDQPITSGSLYAAPFVWKTISSSKAPAGYADYKGRAALWAYQPIQYVNPGDWSGSLLTAGTEFSNPNHPVAQATDADVPLIGFTQAYPAHWQGLIEIRMLFTGVDKGQIQAPYPAAIVRVSGTKWTLVEGGNASCSAGLGLSMETTHLAKKKLAKPDNAVPVSTSAPGAGNAGNSGGSSGSAAGGQSASGSNAAGATNLAAKDSSSSGINGGLLAGVGVGAFALVWVGLSLLARRRRRTTA
jgi:hypothetical protein